MNRDPALNEKIVRVIDILEQVEELNKMIELHKNSNPESSSMLSQYEQMKATFVQELNTILKKFQINIQAA